MLRKILPWLVMALLAAILIFGLAMKNRINNSLSEILQQQASPEIILSSEAHIDSLYNYEDNNSDYDITFLEFGAKGCSACKRMEGVMEEIREKYAGKVNVVFINVLLPESQNLMKYYGIAAIPTQILLDKQGKEYFRHTGFISAADLEKEIGINQYSIYAEVSGKKELFLQSLKEYREYAAGIMISKINACRNIQKHRISSRPVCPAGC